VSTGYAAIVGNRFLQLTEKSILRFVNIGDAVDAIDNFP